MEPEWPTEEIPDVDSLYYRVHESIVQPSDGDPRPNMFREQGQSMSSDWDEYSSPRETRQRAGQPPENYGVVRLIVGEVREIDGMQVEHDPIQPHDPGTPNRAHSEIKGMGDEKQRKTMVRGRLYEQVEDRGWEIPPGTNMED